MKRSFLMAVCAALILCLLTVGCSVPENSAALPDSDGTEDLSSPIVSSSDMFTQRDLSWEYDEDECIPVELSDQGGSVTITDEGVYLLRGTLNNGQIVVDADKTAKIQLVLDGVSVRCAGGAALYVKQADKVFVTLAPGSENTLLSTGEFVADGDTNVDGAIFSKEDITLNGTGSLTVESDSGNGIVGKDDLVIAGGTIAVTSAGHGLQGKDSVRITAATLAISSGKDGIHAENADDASLGFLYIEGGQFTITAGWDGIDAKGTVEIVDGSFTIETGGGSEVASTTASSDPNTAWGRWDPAGQTTTTAQDSASAKGIKSTGSMALRGGSFTIDSSDDCLHSNDSLLVEGGSFLLTSGDDGIHADAEARVSGGDIVVTRSYEGLEGKSVVISGGSVTITASDDGINAAGGNDASALGGRPGMNQFAADGDCFIEISGGVIVIDAGGDGVDSNGTLTVSGGETYVNGPVDNGNSALDCDGQATITGGIFLAAGSNGMAQNFASASTQGSILVATATGQSAGSEILLTDSSGNALVRYAPSKAYSSVVVSAPGVAVGETYSLTVGSETFSIEMTSSTYSSSGGFGMGQVPGGGMQGQGGGMAGGHNDGQRPGWGA